jgi:hypothetical protein
MHRKDFEAIASVIRRASYTAGITNAQTETLALNMAATLRSANPNFDANRFIDACLPGNA